MLPEFSASQMLVVAIVALIVVGPKDLPVLLRQLGKMVSKMRALAADFRSSFDEMARQSELDELAEGGRGAAHLQARSAEAGPRSPLRRDAAPCRGRPGGAGRPAGRRPGPHPRPGRRVSAFRPCPMSAPEPQPISALEAELAAEPDAKARRKPRAPRKPKAPPGGRGVSDDDELGGLAPRRCSNN